MMSQLGSPLQVWRMEGSEIVLDKQAVDSILRNPEHNGKKVVIITITGPTRWGKSFLLNYILRYLQASDKSNWLGSADAQLRGFDWARGASRVTQGILLWSAPFVTNHSNDEQVVVLVMDTQGTFDMNTSFSNCSKLCALSTFVSSMVIYNLQGHIMQNLLGYLRYFTDYGRSAVEDNVEETALVQQLTFLIRDWANDHEFAYGWLGGEKYLKQQITVSPNDPPELNDTRRQIRNTFATTNCFLMSHPVAGVLKNLDFDGEWGSLNTEFVSDLKSFAEIFLSNQNLCVKRLHGQEILWEQLPNIFQAITDALSQPNLPDPKDLVALAIELKSKSVVELCMKLYTDHMGNIDYTIRQLRCQHHFVEEHDAATRKAIDLLRSKLKQHDSIHWEHVLKERIDQMFAHFRFEFMVRLRKFHDQHNKTVFRECLDDFIVNLPLKSEHFDPQQMVAERLQRNLLGDEKTQSTYERNLAKKMKDLCVLYQTSDVEKYKEYTDFFEVWRRKVTKEQQDIATYMSTRVWNEIDCDSQSALLTKLLLFALFAKTLTESRETEVKVVGFVASKLKELGKLEDKSCLLRFAILFVNGMCESNLHSAAYPLFRVMKDDGQSTADSYFLDHLGRLYENWESYLAENLLDGYWLCAPANGEYTIRDSAVQLQLIDQTKRNVVWNKTDKMMKYIVLDAFLILGAAFLTLNPSIRSIGSSLLAAALTGCSMVSTYAKLSERREHGQNIFDEEGLQLWTDLSLKIGLSVTVGVQTVVGLVRLVKGTTSLRSLLSTGLKLFSTSSMIPDKNICPTVRRDKASALLLLLKHFIVPAESDDLPMLLNTLGSTHDALAKENLPVDFIRRINHP